jgi:hypothetical protein
MNLYRAVWEDIGMSWYNLIEVWFIIADSLDEAWEMLKEKQPGYEGFEMEEMGPIKKGIYGNF